MSESLFQSIIKKFRANYEKDSYSELSDNIAQIRKLIFDDKEVSIQKFFQAGITKQMFSLFRPNLPEDVLHETCWLLINISAEGKTNSAYIKLFQQYNIPARAVDMASFEISPKILEDCIWILGNISADSIFYRDYILRKTAIISALYTQMDYRACTTGFLKTVLFLCRNLVCQQGLKKPESDFFEKDLEIILIVTHLHLRMFSDPEVNEMCAEILSEFLKHYDDDQQIQEVWKMYLCKGPPLHEFIDKLKDPELSDVFKQNSLTFFGQLLLCSAKCSDHMIDSGIYDLIQAFMIDDNELVVKKTLWLFSNLIADQETTFLPQLIAQDTQIFSLLNQIVSSVSKDNFTEIIICVTNILEFITQENFDILVDKVTFGNFFTRTLSDQNSEMIELLLDCTKISNCSEKYMEDLSTFLSTLKQHYPEKLSKIENLEADILVTKIQKLIS